MGTITEQRKSLPATNYYLLTTIFLALSLRIVWVAWSFNAGVRPASDAAWYYERGVEIAGGAGYSLDGAPTAYWPVGYPGFLGGLFSIFGDSILAAMIANIVLYLVVIYASCQVAQTLFESQKVARITGLILAVYPNHIAYTSLLLGEILSLALLMMGIALMIGPERNLWKSVAAGGLLGGAALVKPQLLLLPLVVVIVRAVIDRNRWRGQWGQLAIIYGVALAILLPWSLRNVEVFGRHGILSTNDGINLFIGNNPYANGTYRLNDTIEGLYWDAPGEYERNAQARSLAIDYILSHPGRILGLLPLKLWYLYRGDADGFTWNRRYFGENTVSPVTRTFDWLKIFSQICWVVFVIACVGAIVVQYRSRRKQQAIRWSWAGAGVIGYITLLGLIYFGDPRFHFPIIPWMAMYLGAGIVIWRSSRPLPGPLPMLGEGARSLPPSPNIGKGVAEGRRDPACGLRAISKQHRTMDTAYTTETASAPLVGSNAGAPLLEVRNLKVHFPVFGGIFQRKVATVKAVDGITFNIYRGETLGMVGESGCGKTTVGRALINIIRTMSPDAEATGEILYHGSDGNVVDFNKLSKSEMRPYRSKIQMIFQDPYSSLNPRMTVSQIIEEPLALHTKMSKTEIKDRVGWLLGKVGMQPEQAGRYPHEFSGGQRQRIGIARALATQPDLIICDEPVSALDVSIQAQVINLMMDLQEEFGLSFLFIAHDLSVVEHISNRIAVMYLGHMVEYGSSEQVYFNPKHPYSQALLSAVPLADPDGKRLGRTVLTGDVPTPLAKPSGCPFRTRCPIARPDCAEAFPPYEEKEPGHWVACPYVE